MSELEEVDLDKLDQEIKIALTEAEPEPDIESEYTETELEAIDAGWRPDGKDKDGHTLTADEYLARKPLFNKINKLNNKLDEMTKQVKGLQEHNRISTERAIKEKEQLMEELKAAKEKAYEDLDVDEARKIDKQIEALSEETAKPQLQYTEKDFTDAYDGFVKENPWYESNPGLKAAATNIGQVFIQENPDISPEKLYEHVITETRRLFPEHFEEKKRPTAVGTTNTRTKPTGHKRKHTLSEIPEQHRQMAKVIIASGVSEEEYLKQYFLEE